MIIFVIGTTAELLKIQLVVKRLLAEGRRPVVLSTEQQKLELQNSELGSLITHRLERRFMPSLESALQALPWTAITLIQLCQSLRRIIRSNAHQLPTIVVVHGDTLSTLIGAFSAKILRVHLAHIEAGLRSGRLFDPFPEEVTRRIVSQLSDIDYAPGPAASNVLRNKKSQVIDTGFNTSYEVVLQTGALRKVAKHADQYCLISLHRTELLQNAKLLSQTISVILSLSNQIRVVMVIDTHTRARLQQLNLIKLIEGKNRITLLNKLDQQRFLELLVNSQFIVTDSGGTQEESALMGIPCLVYRKTTERQDGIGRNVVVAGKRPELILKFSQDYLLYRFIPHEINDSPSAVISEHLSRFVDLSRESRK